MQLISARDILLGLMTHHPTHWLAILLLALEVGRKPKNVTMEFNEFTHSKHIYDLWGKTWTNQKSLTLLGNKLLIAGTFTGPSDIMSSSAIYSMLHSCWVLLAFIMYYVSTKLLMHDMYYAKLVPNNYNML